MTRRPPRRPMPSRPSACSTSWWPACWPSPRRSSCPPSPLAPRCCLGRHVHHPRSSTSSSTTTTRRRRRRKRKRRKRSGTLGWPGFVRHWRRRLRCRWAMTTRARTKSIEAERGGGWGGGQRMRTTNKTRMTKTSSTSTTTSKTKTHARHAAPRGPARRRRQRPPREALAAAPADGRNGRAGGGWWSRALTTAEGPVRGEERRGWRRKGREGRSSRRFINV